jgi:hypothetical protein
MIVNYSNSLIGISRRTFVTALPVTYAVPIVTYNTDP